MPQSRIYNFSDEEFIEIVKSSSSISECCRRLGLSDKGKNGRDQINKRCILLGIDFEELRNKGQLAGAYRTRQSNEEILVENSTYKCTSRLKKRLVDEGLLEYKCAICGNTGEWQGKFLVLQLDHINGINNDHRLEDLRLLCPNCHSQTETYSGRNK